MNPAAPVWSASRAEILMQAPAPPLPRSSIPRFARWLSHLRAEPAFVLALLLTIPALLPLAAPGYFFGAHDGRHTVFWLLEFDRAFSDGALWPIWVPDHVLGFGYPLWLVYAPLSFFVAEAFHLLGLGLTAAVKAAWAFWFILGAVGMFRLTRRWWGPGAAGRIVGLHLRALSPGGHLRPRRACRIRGAGDRAVGSARAGECLGAPWRENRGAGRVGARRAAVDAQHGPGGLRPAGRGFRCVEGVAGGRNGGATTKDEGRKTGHRIAGEWLLGRRPRRSSGPALRSRWASAWR